MKSILKTIFFILALLIAAGEVRASASHLIDRGFTGHQHLDVFNLINMNGRVYDPVVQQFLSPDPYVQFSENPLNYNRYAYALFNPMYWTDPTGDSLKVTNNAGNFLFMLDDGTTEMTTNTARQVYDRGIQWFASDADNYMPMISMAKNISKIDGIKHFTSAEIMKFAEKDRWMSSYRPGGSGDWKQSKEGGDGYFLVTVDGKPYWGDAIGQIPFAINCFTKELLKTLNYEQARNYTIESGQKYGDGRIINPTADNSNSYDNAMIERTVRWASQAYKVVRVNGKTLEIRHTDRYNPLSLFIYR